MQGNKISLDDPKLFDYLNAHLQEGWSITNFHKYINKKDYKEFRAMMLSKPEYLEVMEKYRKYYISPYGKIRPRVEFV